MKKPKKKLKYQTGGAPRDNTQVNLPMKTSSYFDSGTNTVKNYPRTPSPGDAARTFNQQVINPSLDFLRNSMFPGEIPMKAGPEIFEGQKAQNYLNSQMINKAGNPIGTKANLKVIGEGDWTNPGNFDYKYQNLSQAEKDVIYNKEWKGDVNFDPKFQGSTDVPAIKRAEQMDILKEYKPSTLNPKKVDPMASGLIHNNYPYENRPGYPPQAAAYPDFHKNWNWDISPQDINSVKNSPLDMQLRYHDSNQYGGPITDPRGQWAHPGQVTKIPSNNITMQGVNYPVLGVSNTGHQQMMQPGASYQFPGTSVTEYPMMTQRGLVNKGMMQAGGSLNKNKVDLSKTSNGSYYNPVEDRIYFDKNDDRTNPNAVYQHERYHKYQHDIGKDRIPDLYQGPIRKPIKANTSDGKQAGLYYNRGNEDINNLTNDFLRSNPSFNFVNGDLLYDKQINPEQYQITGTQEGDARAYENYVREHGKPMFGSPSKSTLKKHGGSTDDQFPDEQTFPEQRKNEFLGWLTQTAQQEKYNQMVESMGMMKSGGGFKINPAHKGWSIGDEVDISPEEAISLRAQGYKFDIL